MEKFDNIQHEFQTKIAHDLLPSAENFVDMFFNPQSGALSVLMNKAISTSRNISNYFYYKKLNRVLSGINDYEDNIKFLDKYVNENPEKFLEKFLLIIDQIDEMEKADYIVKAFRIGILREYPVDEVFLVIHVILNIYSDSILYFLKIKEDEIEENAHSSGLAAQGLLIISGIDPRVTSQPFASMVSYCVSAFGNRFREYLQ